MRAKDDSVALVGLRGAITAGALLLDRWHQEQTGRELVITSGAERIPHSVPRSAHYRGDAVDVRNWYLKEENPDLDFWASQIRELLGNDYVVINEGTHFHIHWSPVYEA